MRLAGINIPENKRLEIGLTALFGVGRSSAREILENAGMDFSTRPRDLSPHAISQLKQAVERYKIEGELRRVVSGNIKRLKEIKCYRGIRHSRHLPVRGQRTKSNSRTVRGNVRRTMGSGKRKVEKK